MDGPQHGWRFLEAGGFSFLALEQLTRLSSLITSEHGTLPLKTTAESLIPIKMASYYRPVPELQLRSTNSLRSATIKRSTSVNNRPGF